MIKKRILPVLLSLVLVIGALPVMPLLQETAQVSAKEVNPEVNEPDESIEETGTGSSGKKSPGKVKIEVDPDNPGSLWHLPDDGKTGKVDPHVSLDDAKNMLVSNGKRQLKGYIGLENEDTLPSSYPNDYSDKDSLRAYLKSELPPLRDQMDSGTCWVHSVIGALEAYLLKHENSNDIHDAIKKDSDGKTPGINYSELQLAYFVRHNNINPLIGNQKDIIVSNFTNESFWSLGADEAYAVRALMNWRGPVDESVVPLYDRKLFDSKYEMEAKEGIDEFFSYNNDSVHIANTYWINIFSNADQVKQAIQANGAVTFAYNQDAYYYDSKNNSYYNSSNNYANHVVCIVGWDDNFPKDNFTATEFRPENNGAWLVRNSWMDSLSNPADEILRNNGYFWISYEDTTIQKETYVIEAESSDNYDNNYFYTNLLSSTFSDNDLDEVANVFTMNGFKGADKETVSAVGLLTKDTNVSYTISICSVDDYGYPDTSNPLCEDTSGLIVFPGEYTIPLNKPVTLNRGVKFAVVVRTDGGTISMEQGLYDNDVNNNWTSYVYANPGESFYFNSNKWNDLAYYYVDNYGDLGNFYIRVFTSDDESTEQSVKGLKCTGRTTDSISLEWDSLEKDVTYDVYRWIGTIQDDYNDELIASGLGVNKFTDSNLPPCSRCYYYIVPVKKYESRFDLSSQIIAVETVPVDNAAPSEPILAERIEGYYAAIIAAVDIWSTYKSEIEYKRADTDEWISMPSNWCYIDGVGYCIPIIEDSLAPGKYLIRCKSDYVNLYGEPYKGAYNVADTEVISFYPATNSLTADYDKNTSTVTLNWESVENAPGYDVFEIETDWDDNESLSKINKSVVTGCAITISDVQKEKIVSYAVYVHDDSMNLSDNRNYAYGNFVDVDTYSKPAPKATDFEFHGPDNGEIVYNGKPYAATVTSNIPIEETGEYTVYYRDSNSDLWTTEAPRNAGYYYVALDIPGGTVYRKTSKITDEDWEFEIKERNLYVDADELSKEEGDEDPEFTFTYSGNLEGEIPAFTGEIDREYGETAGRYKYKEYTLELVDNGAFLAQNYLLKFNEDKEFVITPIGKLSAPAVTVKSVTATSVELQFGEVAKAKGYAVFYEDELMYVTNKPGCILEYLEAETSYKFHVYAYWYRDLYTVEELKNQGYPTLVEFTTSAKKVLVAADFEFNAPQNCIFDKSEHIAEIVPTVKVDIETIYYRKEGSDAWQTEAVEVGTYQVAVDTFDSSEYEAADKLTDPSWTFEILPMDQVAPNAPASEIIASENIIYVSYVELPADWVWADADKYKYLSAGTVVSATAVYVGKDKENYKVVSVTVSVIKQGTVQSYTPVYYYDNSGNNGGGSSGTGPVVVVPPSSGSSGGGTGKDDKTDEKSNVDDSIVKDNKNGTVTVNAEKKNSDGTITKIQSTINENGELIKTVSETVKKTKKTRTTVTITETPDIYSVKTLKEKSDGTMTAETIEKDLVTNKVTIIKESKDKDGNIDKKTYTVLSEPEGTDKKAKGTVSLKKDNSNVENGIIPKTIKADGKKYTVTSITARAYMSNKLLKTMVIGANITRIGKKAFAYTRNLTDITIYADTYPYIGKNAFKGISPEAKITIVTADKQLFRKIRKRIKKTGVPETVTFIWSNPNEV